MPAARRSSEADVVVVADRRVPSVDGIGLAAAASRGGRRRHRGRQLVPHEFARRVRGGRCRRRGDVDGGRPSHGRRRRDRCHGRERPHAAGGGATRPAHAAARRLDRPGRGCRSPIGSRCGGRRRRPRDQRPGGRRRWARRLPEGRCRRGTGEILGVHVVGPAADEILAVAGTAMQAELTVADVAATRALAPEPHRVTRRGRPRAGLTH